MNVTEALDKVRDEGASAARKHHRENYSAPFSQMFEVAEKKAEALLEGVRPWVRTSDYLEEFTSAFLAEYKAQRDFIKAQGSLFG